MVQIIKKNESWVVFIGGPRHLALEQMIKCGYKISQVIFPYTDNYRLDKSIELCKIKQIPINKIKRNDLCQLKKLIKDKPCLSLGFPYLFKKDFLSLSKIFINVHGTLLPKYRGACTLNWIIENGEKESGVTVHLIDEGCDTGDIVYQKSFPISIFDTGKSLYRKTLEFEPTVLQEALQMISEDRYKLLSQNDSNIKQLPNRKPEHSKIDPNKSINELFNQIRASDPIDYPAYFIVNEEKVCIKLWRESNLITREEDMI